MENRSFSSVSQVASPNTSFVMTLQRTSTKDEFYDDHESRLKPGCLVLGEKHGESEEEGKEAGLQVDIKNKYVTRHRYVHPTGACNQSLP